jgi:hypothetical protein
MRWLVIVFAGCVVTQPPTMAQRPQWRLDGDALLATPCMNARAFVRKSGKQGIGMTLELKSFADCKVSVGVTSITWPDGRGVTQPGLAPIELRGHSLYYAWLPIFFDNDAAWNHDRNRARVEITVTVADRSETWTIPVLQR